MLLRYGTMQVHAAAFQFARLLGDCPEEEDVCSSNALP
jgi:hypothetical protein